MGKNRIFAHIKRVVFFLIIFVVSFLIITPTYAAAKLGFFKDFILDNLSGNLELRNFVQNYFQIVVSFMVNFVLIPFLIDLSVQFEDFRRKSSKQISIMRKTFFFMLINFIILPIFQLTIEKYFEKLNS